MKKKILITLFALMFPFTFAYANVDDDDWTYFFYLQYKEGVLAPEEGAAYPYDPVPSYFDGPRDEETAKQADFYGVVVSGKGVKLAYTGFNKPETSIAALGKSVFTVKVPFYANANRVDFYQKGGKKLFSISVSASSFCDDNNKCNVGVGENFRNCPNDCPPPPGGIPPREVVPPPQPVTPEPVTLPAPETPLIEPIAEDVGTVLPSTAEVVTNEAPLPKKGVDTTTIVVVVTGILALLLAGLMFYLRKAMHMNDESQ